MLRRKSSQKQGCLASAGRLRFVCTLGGHVGRGRQHTPPVNRRGPEFTFKGIGSERTAGGGLTTTGKKTTQTKRVLLLVRGRRGGGGRDQAIPRRRQERQRGWPRSDPPLDGSLYRSNVQRPLSLWKSHSGTSVKSIPGCCENRSRSDPESLAPSESR